MATNAVVPAVVMAAVAPAVAEKVAAALATAAVNADSRIMERGCLKSRQPLHNLKEM